MESLSPQRKAMLQMILCASLWSIAGIFIKQIPWNPLVIAGARSLISGIFIFIYLKIKRVRFQFTRSAAISAVLMCCTFVAFVTANKLTTAANAIVLQFTAPVFLLIFSALIFHQKLRRADGITVFVTLLGIALFFFVTLWLAGWLNPGILDIIESLSGPVIAMILFIMPMYAVHKIPAMSRYRGQWSNAFVLAAGCVAISSLLYKLF